MLEDYNKFLKETRRGIQYNQKKLKTALELNKKREVQEKRRDLMNATQALDVNKFNYRFQNYQKQKEKNRETLLQRQKSETLAQIKTEFRNDLSKQLTSDQPSFQKRVD